MKVTVNYTPNYPGAKLVNRKHNFKTPEEGYSFINRMERMYPDAVISHTNCQGKFVQLVPCVIEN